MAKPTNRYISKNATTVNFLKIIGGYVVYDNLFGNVLKSNIGQVLHKVPINAIKPYYDTLKDNTKLKLQFLNISSEGNITGMRCPFIKSQKISHTISYAPTQRILFDPLIPIDSIYYYFDLGDYYLFYDFDFGNPLSVDGKTPKFNKKDYIKEIVDKLPKTSTIVGYKSDFTEIVKEPGILQNKSSGPEKVKQLKLDENNKTANKLKKEEIKGNIREYNSVNST